MQNDQRMYLTSKRLFDICISGLVLLLTGPLAVLIAYAIHRHDGGPPVYRATRVGIGGRDFVMYKFRTMVIDADRRGGDSTSDNDSRITTVGRWLRACKFDELPQLVNVLLGDMSLVGPRPQVRRDVDRYTPSERRLLLVKPGVTDWASLTFRHEGRILAEHSDPDDAYNRLIRPEKIRLGLLYVERASLRTDLGILLSTLSVVLGGPSGIARRKLAYHRVTEDWQTKADAHQWSSARARYSVAASLGAGVVLAEVGCGTGFGLAKVAPFTALSIGIDVEERNLHSARSHSSSLLLIQGNAEALPIREDSVDCLIGLEMLYYLPDVGRFLRESHRVLRQGGRLLLTVPNPTRHSFSPSPYSVAYPTYEELVQLVKAAGFDPTIFGATLTGQLPRLREMLRRLVVRSGVLPTTMKGRARAKGVINRGMRELQSITLDPDGALADLALVATGEEADQFAQLVCIGIRL